MSKAGKGQLGKVSLRDGEVVAARVARVTKLEFATSRL